MKISFDASAIVAMIASDVGWTAISDWLIADDPAASYSDFCWGEVQSALGNRVRSGEFTAEYAHGLIAEFKAYAVRWTFVRVTSADIDDATHMVADFSLGLRLPDAIHIAVAQRLGLTLVSTDIRQVRAAATLGIAAINPLHTDGTHS